MTDRPILFSGPMVRAGDRLWVREAHFLTDDGENDYAVYVADGNDATGEHLHEVAALEKLHPGLDWSKHKRQRPSIHMPRWASRLTLTVTDVRVQRLQEIGTEDAAAEGLVKLPVTGRYVIAKGDQYFGAADLDPRVVFAWLWNSLNAERGHGWDANPWVTATTFTVERRNIDEVA